jgi:hypothetical protein
MRRLTCLTAVLSLLLVSTAWSQELAHRITNKDVIDMVALGLSEDVIIAKIRSASAGESLQFDTSLAGLKELKAANVPDAVLKVMINPTPPAAPVVMAATAISNDPNLPPPEVGVYWKNGNAFVLIEGQAVSHSKVGGKAGSFYRRFEERTLGCLLERPDFEPRRQRTSADLLSLCARRKQRIRLCPNQT